jgi:hypothetical protein
MGEEGVRGERGKRGGERGERDGKGWERLRRPENLPAGPFMHASLLRE